jgi:hypothetical protein
MSTFLAEWLFVLVILIGYGAIGGFVDVPFRHALPFGALAAPFSGLLLMAFGATFTYDVLGRSLWIGHLATGTLDLAAKVWTMRRASVRPCGTDCWSRRCSHSFSLARSRRSPCRRRSCWVTQDSSTRSALITWAMRTCPIGSRRTHRPSDPASILPYRTRAGRRYSSISIHAWEPSLR